MLEKCGREMSIVAWGGWKFEVQRLWTRVAVAVKLSAVDPLFPLQRFSFSFILGP